MGLLFHFQFFIGIATLRNGDIKIAIIIKIICFLQGKHYITLLFLLPSSIRLPVFPREYKYIPQQEPNTATSSFDLSKSDTFFCPYSDLSLDLSQNFLLSSFRKSLILLGNWLPSQQLPNTVVRLGGIQRSLSSCAF